MGGPAYKVDKDLIEKGSEEGNYSKLVPTIRHLPYEGKI